MFTGSTPEHLYLLTDSDGMGDFEAAAFLSRVLGLQGNSSLILYSYRFYWLYYVISAENVPLSEDDRKLDGIGHVMAKYGRPPGSRQRQFLPGVLS